MDDRTSQPGMNVHACVSINQQRKKREREREPPRRVVEWMYVLDENLSSKAISHRDRRRDGNGDLSTDTVAVIQSFPL